MYKRQPQIVYTLTPVVANSYTYTAVVCGKGIAETTATFTSDASATAGEIATGLAAALNAVVAKNFTAVADATTIVVTGTVAGDWFSIEIVPTACASLLTHADPGVATDLTALMLADSGWYAFTTVGNSEALVKAAAAWAEANKRLYLFDTSDTNTITATADGTQGTLDDIKTLAYSYTSGWYHPSAVAMLASGVLGKCLPLDAGSETWKFKTIVGVTTVSLTATQRLNLRARNGNTYETSRGVNMTYDGKVASGNYIDYTRNLDWINDDMSASVFEVFVGATKIPFTDAGIAVVENAMRGSLKRAYARTMINEDFTITVPLAADVSAADKAARNLPDLKFAATMQGAVHSAEIDGVVSL